MMGARCTWIFLFYLICVTDSINVSSDVVDIGVFCCLFVVCIYIYVRLVTSSYLLFCCIYFDAWCITCYPKREETISLHRVIAYIYVRGLCHFILLNLKNASCEYDRWVVETQLCKLRDITAVHYRRTAVVLYCAV